MLKAETSSQHGVISDYMRRGQYLRAYDSALSAMGDYPKDVSLKYTAVLCLLRGRALSSAQKLFERLDLSRESHEDILALSGRLAKTEAETLGGPERTALFTHAASLYENAYEVTGGSYSGVNAASLWYLCGDNERARLLATTLLKTSILSGGATSQDEYYYHATRAECYFILGQIQESQVAMQAAIAADADNISARASTIQQFGLLCRGDIPAWLSTYKIPKCIHYTGHMFRIGAPGPDRSLTQKDTVKIETDIAAYFQKHPISAAFGALAAGADILFAEQCLAADVDLNIVLPVPPVVFCDLSVSPMGDDWVSRFEAILPCAQSVTVILDEPDDFDILDVTMASQIAMGMARLQAERLHTDVCQLRLIDEKLTTSQSHKDSDVWQMTGGNLVTFNWPGSAALEPAAILREPDGRAFRAMLFTDLKGYGQISDRRLPDIVERIFTPMAEICRILDIPPLQLKSWGDGLFLVFETVEGAAAAAFALMTCFETQVASLKADLSLRIGGHFGPVWERQDPFTDSDNLYGRHVAIASRLESMALPGSIYVTEMFAAQLAMQQTQDLYGCDYIGQLKSEKETHPFSTYALLKKNNIKL